MRKFVTDNIIAGLILSLFIMGCGADVAPATTTQATTTPLKQEHYAWEDQEINGMTYRVYIVKYITSQTGYAIAVVNITKDELEVQLLKKQLGVKQ